MLKCPDDRKTELSAPKRRTRAEVQRLVAEFVSSGVRRSEFCQSRGLSFSTLDRHLLKGDWSCTCARWRDIDPLAALRGGDGIISVSPQSASTSRFWRPRPNFPDTSREVPLLRRSESR